MQACAKTGKLLVATILATIAIAAHAQRATISDAWWTFQQDCDGDGTFAGSLSGGFARLNWESDVTNCTGSLTVYERIHFKPCSSNDWTLLTTTLPHTITGCSIETPQYVEVPLGADGVCRDYQIEVFRDGQTTPDYVRSATNDVDLNDHLEETPAQDTCEPDFFSSCWVITGSSGRQSGSNVGATKETGEPDHAGNPGGRSVWFCWTAPTNRPVTFDTIGSSFDTLLGVYLGNNVSNLSLIASNDDIAGADNRQSSVTFTPVSGLTYHVAIDGYFGATGNAVLNWAQTGVALPDLIIWGPAVSPRVVTETFATNSCEVLEGCAVAGTRKLLRFTNETRNQGAGDLVIGNPAGNPLFHYAACHGHYHFEEFASYRLLDAVGNPVATGGKVGFCLEDVVRRSPTGRLNPRYDCADQGLQVGWADIYTYNLPCQYIDITAVPGGNYTLEMQVDPKGLIPESNETNNLIQIAITIPAACSTAPPNDDFNNRLPLAGPATSVTELTACATKQTGEPNHAGDGGGHSIWYTWTPTATDTAVLSTEGSGFDTLLAVYTGTTVSGLTLVASNDDIGGGTRESRVSFPANVGTAYQIAVDGWDGAVGQALLSLNPPGNNNFAARYPLSGLSGNTNGTTVGATKEVGEPAHGSNIGGHSVWFSWTAPTNGPVEFNTLGSVFDTTLAIYTGTGISNLVAVAGDNNSGDGVTSRLGFSAVAGAPYRIAVDGFGGAAGNYSLNWNMLSRLNAQAMAVEQIQLSLTGVNGQRYQIQTSSNLVHWTALITLTMSDGAQQFTDSVGAGRKFYRAVLVP